MFYFIVLVHGVVARLGAQRFWLVGFYVLMVLALPQLAMFLAVLGLADSWFDFRGRLGRRAG